MSIAGEGNGGKVHAALRLLDFAKEVFVMDAIRIEISSGLIPAVKAVDGGRNLLALIRETRRSLEAGGGARVPRIHVIDNERLPRLSFELFIQEQSAAAGELNDLADLEPLLLKLRSVVLEHQDSIAESN
jgi:flagellar biosynthesis component FlhA